MWIIFYKLIIYTKKKNIKRKEKKIYSNSMNEKLNHSPGIPFEEILKNIIGYSTLVTQNKIKSPKKKK